MLGSGRQQDPPVLEPTLAMTEQGKLPIPALPLTAFISEHTNR